MDLLLTKIYIIFLWEQFQKNELDGQLKSKKIFSADRGVSQDMLISIMQENGFNGKAVEEFLNTYLDNKAKQ